MTLRKAERRQAKLRIGVSGPSGSGKTYSALLLASGMAPWDKIAMIDTENGSGDLYADMGEYNIITLAPPFSPERYVEALKECEAAGMEIIIIDSATHEWDGIGGCLEIVEQVGQASSSKNSYVAWAKVTPRHQKFLQAITQSKCHVITTTRRKQDYDMGKDGAGKTTVTKVGLKEVQREGFEYELTLSFDVDMTHYAVSNKDRTRLFDGVPAFRITPETGQKIMEWAKSGAKAVPIEVPPSEMKDAAPVHLIDRLKKKVPTLKELNEKCGLNVKKWEHLTSKDATACLITLMQK